MSGDGWEILSDNFWGDVPRLLHRWETPQLSAFALHFFFSFWFIFLLGSSLLTLCVCVCVCVFLIYS